MSAARDTLLGMLERDSDMDLIFTTADGITEVVPGHSLILGLWSPVMRAAVEAGSSSNSSTTNRTRVQMTGTSKNDWLMAMEFLYPISPPPVVTWDNLEPQLALADKYCMSALAQRVGGFLNSNSSGFSHNSSSKQFAWKWIYAADKYGLVDIAKKCISEEKHLHFLLQSWPKDQGLAGYGGHRLSAEVGAPNDHNNY